MTDWRWLWGQLPTVARIVGRMGDGVMRRPPVRQIANPFHNARRETDVVEGGLVHSMGEHVRNDSERWGPVGTFHAAEWLQQKTWSAHALIAPEGTVIETVPIDRVAFHAGQSEWRGREWLNHTYLGAEWLVEGEHTYGSFLEAIAKPDCYTGRQYEAGGFLYAWWASICPHWSRDRILSHAIVAGDDVRGSGRGKRDPGAGFDWERFFQCYDTWVTQLAEGAT